MRLISVGQIAYSHAWRMPRQIHHYHEMIVVYRGRIHATIGETTYTGETGGVLVYPAGVLHEEEADPKSGLETRFIAFESDSLPTESGMVRPDDKGRIRQLVQWLQEEWQSQQVDAETRRQLFLAAIVAEWGRLQLPQEDTLVASIRKYIRAHLDQPLTLQVLAERASMSKFHFLRVYKDLAGRTPMEDVRALRVEHAQQLLLTTDLPLKSVAPACGLGDAYHLCRLFRKHFNATPGEIRRACAAGCR